MGKPLKILIVEDSEDDLALLLRELKKGGYEPIYERVDTAAAMSAALEKKSWEIVVSDYSMPTFSAPEAIRILRQKAGDLPFLVMSGTIGEDKAVEILKTGAQDFITKGATLRLIPAIERELKEAAGRRAHQEAEVRLRQSEKRFRSLVHATAQIIWTASASGEAVEDSESWRAYTGQSWEEYKGAGWLSAVHPEDRQKTMESWKRAVETVRLYIIEYRMRAADGRYASFAVRATPVFGSDGALREWVGACTNISERLQLEDQLRRSQKMEAVGQLAGGIAHDFNNLLTIINGRSELLLSRIKPDNSLHREIEMIHDSGERAAALTRQLLAFSRQQVLEPKVISLNSVVSGLNPLLRRLIREDIEISTHLDPALESVKADPGQIEQVIINLTVNARDAMAHGGKLLIETSNVELSDEYCHSHQDVKSGGYVMLAVSDTGCGMEPEVREKIFEPFFTTKEIGKGTGLGLSTVFGIIKQSGGHIAVYSVPAKGTTFKVYLPQTRGMSATLSSDKHTAITKGSETILLVEDDEGVRQLVKELLVMNGYKVLIAQNGREALSVYEEHKRSIDLLITDVIMPGMGGPELVARIASKDPKIKVIFTSGYTDNAIVHNGILNEEVSFLQKPFTPAGLALKVREVLDIGYT